MQKYKLGNSKLMDRQISRRWIKRGFLILVLLIFGASAFTIGSRVYVQQADPQAIVVAESVEVFSGPGEDTIAEFNLHAGAQVKLIERRGQWARLALPGDQFQGWAPVEALEAIY